MPQQATAKLNITIKSICCAKVKGVDEFLEKDEKPETKKEEAKKRSVDSDSSD